MSYDDPLAPYRRNGARPVETASLGQAGEGEVYAACHIADAPQARLWLRDRRSATDHAPGYGAIYDILTDGRSGITLALERMLIDIDGRNLGTLFYHLVRHRVEWIQAFDPERWPEPDAAAPVVTRIGVHIVPPPAQEAEQ